MWKGKQLGWNHTWWCQKDAVSWAVTDTGSGYFSAWRIRRTSGTLEDKVKVGEGTLSLPRQHLQLSAGFQKTGFRAVGLHPWWMHRECPACLMAQRFPPDPALLRIAQCCSKPKETNHTPKQAWFRVNCMITDKLHRILERMTCADSSSLDEAKSLSPVIAELESFLMALVSLSKGAFHWAMQINSKIYKWRVYV